MPALLSVPLFWMFEVRSIVPKYAAQNMPYDYTQFIVVKLLEWIMIHVLTFDFWFKKLM